MTIADLRKDLGLSLEAFAQLIGLQSRGRMSVIERENRCSLSVALKIEELSEGRLDAGELSDEVRAARHGFNVAAVQQGRSTGQISDLSGSNGGVA
ncbi:helix-turn-helix domain-containing protein [Novosphingobium clariflavum]|uniref:HTH cro/C1-type domain-containing protein n=1 Tax=Novosphingobium clariflavum TaxID=2029884 RepID=A0ABV6S5Y7_9SPHN|nr:helix-turn-helix transcriptional regulator [Novosphingobium clariflavum]